MKFLRYDSVAVIFVSLWTLAFGQTVDMVKSLYTNILSGYDIRIRPRTDQSMTVEVTSRFVPNNIIEFDTTDQKFSVLGYLEVAWRDEVIQWDKALYGNTESVKVPLKQIWNPSLILAKAFDGDGLIGESDTDMATVHYTGNISWLPDGIFSFVCEVNIQYYPFDEQVCTLTYYVSDETFATVSLSHDDEVTMDQYIENSEWDLVQITKRITERYKAYFIDIHFVVQRRANFATFTIIVPLLMLAFLNICVFLVPIDSGEKGSFSITVFLSYGIFVTIVSDTLPHNSLQISYFVLFLIVLLMLSVLSVFYTIMQAKLVAAYGDKECKISMACFRRKRKGKVHPDEDSSWELEEMDKGETPNIPETVQTETNAHDTVVVPYDDKKIALEDENEKADDDNDKDMFTWRLFFERLDTFLFVLFFILISAASTVFFCLMMQRLGVDTFEGMNI